MKDRHAALASQLWQLSGIGGMLMVGCLCVAGCDAWPPTSRSYFEGECAFRVNGTCPDGLLELRMDASAYIHDRDPGHVDFWVRSTASGAGADLLQKMHLVGTLSADYVVEGTFKEEFRRDGVIVRTSEGTFDGDLSDIGLFVTFISDVASPADCGVGGQILVLNQHGLREHLAAPTTSETLNNRSRQQHYEG